MPRKAFPLIALVLLSPLVLVASRANGDPRLEKLYGQFIAPCCWAETLLVHSSPLADQMRSEIARWVAEGRTDEQIKAVYVERYSTRVLSMPEGASFEWLVWTPLAALAAGLGIALLAIRRLRRAPAAAVAQESMPLPDIDQLDWEVK
jgi:cytochrome c-type biogenesis protein CcmH